ncbi:MULTISPECIES: hypothetical protein [unclassified Ruegeria]|uniref:hypothetical protein n=1 Tax=unclassified Ruegeria TaxID=2625375 RepID=UPI001489B88A|nr:MULTISPECIES: hypothetical protein [unclassified Ruegeria]NOD65649.1 hypothetical protein [Ruegeria sp. HKCCD6109]
MADSDRKQPIEVRVTEMPEAFTLLLKSLSDRLTAMETRENELRQTISDLEDRIDELEDGGEMMVGASLPPVTSPLASAAAEVMADDRDTQIVDAQKFSQALGEQILAGSNDSDDFTIDNVKVEAFVGLGQDGETAQIATNAKKQVISQNASKVTFSVRRRSPTKIIK